MVIKGKDLIFYILIDGQNVPICHARTCEINTTAGILPTTTFLSGNAETNDYSKKYAYTLKCEGVNDAFDLASNFTLQQLQTSFTKVNWTFTDNSNIQWYGVVLITSTTFDSSFDSLSTFSNDLLGDGEYTFIQSDIPPIPPVGSSVNILDQFGNLIAVIQAPGNYIITKFDTIDLHFWDIVNSQPIVPDITITQQI